MPKRKSEIKLLTDSPDGFLRAEDKFYLYSSINFLEVSTNQLKNLEL